MAWWHIMMTLMRSATLAYEIRHGTSLILDGAVSLYKRCAIFAHFKNIDREFCYLSLDTITYDIGHFPLEVIDGR